MVDDIESTESWIEQFSDLSCLDAQARSFLESHSQEISADEGSVIFKPGSQPESLLLLLEGVVRVQQLSAQGREIVLYRIHAGETCVLTTACLLACEGYAAQGIAETRVRAIAVPKAMFDDLIARSACFRQFVFSSYSKRITDLFFVIEEIAFQRLDIRLAQKLLKLMDSSGTVKLTHQQMAVELGTAREVVSRQLQEFQRRGWIVQRRAAIQVQDKTSIVAYLGPT